MYKEKPKKDPCIFIAVTVIAFDSAPGNSDTNLAVKAKVQRIEEVGQMPFQGNTNDIKIIKSACPGVVFGTQLKYLNTAYGEINLTCRIYTADK